MLLDIISPNNYVSYNVKLAEIFGLQGAVYLSVLMNVYQKATNKHKLVNGDFFKIDRTYVYKNTRISIEEQTKLDLSFVKLGIIKKDKTSEDTISLDIKLILSIMSSENKSKIEELQEEFHILNLPTKQETKRAQVCKALKDSIEIPNYDLNTALREWVDSIFQDPKKFLSKKSVSTFINKLCEYCLTNNVVDTKKAIAITNIASSQGYTSCDYAINYYEKQLSTQQKEDKRVRTTTQKVIENTSELSEDEF